MYNHSQLKNKEYTSLILATYMQFPLLMLQSLCYLFLGESAFIHNIVLVLAVVFMLICIPVWIKYKLINICLIYGMVLFIYLTQYALFSENRPYFEEYTFSLFFICLPCCINVSILGDSVNHIFWLKRMSILIFIIGEAYFISVFMIGGQNLTYSMSYSYYMLLPALFFIYFYYKYKSIAYMVLSILSFISMFLIGSRGAAITWILYFVISFFISKNKITYKGIVVIAFTLFLMFYQKLLDWINKILLNFGIQSRSLLLLEQGQLLNHDSGRGNLRQITINIIREHPFLGNGVGSDYRILGEYTHNIVLDLFMHFGIVVGSMFLMGIIVIVAVGFLKSKDKQFALVFISYGAIPILVSGTYLSASNFWIMLGFLFSQIPIAISCNLKQKTTID